MYVKMADVDAAIYVRQSADRTGEELAISRQRDDGTKLAHLRGWRVAATMTDNDLSAAGKKKRPGFEAVLEAIQAGTVQVVIAWDMSRLTRNRRDTLRLLEAGEKAGIVLAFVRGSDLDLSTPAGRLTADILSGVARHEIDQKSDRQKRAVSQAAAAGKWVGGRRPFGFEPDGVTIRETEADALKAAYKDILAGVKLARIARALNAKGFATPQKTRGGEVSWWTAQTLGPMLLNPRYAGLRAVSIRPEHGRPKWEIVGKAVWPALVEEETWLAAKSVLVDPRRSTPPRSGRALLTGLALCGVCPPEDPAPVHGGRNKFGHRTYRCSAVPGHVCRQAEPVDEYVGEIIVARLSRPDARALLEPERPDSAPLRSEVLALRQRLDALALEFADGDLTASQLRSATARIKERLAVAEGELADAGRVNVLGPLIVADDATQAWNEMDVDRQRAVVDTLMTVRLHSVGRGTRTFRLESVGIDWKEVA